MDHSQPQAQSLSIGLSPERKTTVGNGDTGENTQPMVPLQQSQDKPQSSLRGHRIISKINSARVTAGFWIIWVPSPQYSMKSFLELCSNDVSKSMPGWGCGLVGRVLI